MLINAEFVISGKNTTTPASGLIARNFNVFYIEQLYFITKILTINIVYKHLLKADYVDCR